MTQAPAPPRSPIPSGLRPSAARAAAAARLAGISPSSPPAPRTHRSMGIAGTAALAEKLAPWSRPRPEEEARPRHLEVVEPRTLSPAQRRRRARALLIFGVGVATAIALALVYLHVVLAQRQFQLDQMNATVQKDQATYQDLRLQVAQLGSPAHIISTAEGRLGMVQPSKVIYLKPGSDAAGLALGSGGSSVAPAGSQAPAGDADWPLIKSQLAGTP